jgi:hypothetical protein
MGLETVSPVGGKITERELSQSIVNAARELGWKVYRTWNSIHSPKGFPDLTMVRGDRLIFAELKTDAGKVTPDQQSWLDALNVSGRCEVYLWRPADLEAAYKILLTRP